MQKHHTWNTAVFKIAGLLVLGLFIFNIISLKPVYAATFMVTKMADTLAESMPSPFTPA